MVGIIGIWLFLQGLLLLLEFILNLIKDYTELLQSVLEILELTAFNNLPEEIIKRIQLIVESFEYSIEVFELLFSNESEIIVDESSVLNLDGAQSLLLLSLLDGWLIAGLVILLTLLNQLL